MNITCVIPATSSYMYALGPCIRRVNAAIHHAKSRRDISVRIVVVTDEKGASAAEMMNADEVLTVDMPEGEIRYKEDAQLLIANLQQVGFTYAVDAGSDLLWSVESDVLVPYNALSCSLDMLEFDDEYYDVAFVTYPSQSGAMFLGGNGTPQNPIAEDFLLEEREVPDDLLKRHDEAKKSLESGTGKQEDYQAIMEEVKKCSPKGNVFKLNGDRWRARGWLDNAYPAIGRGAVMPTDWTGLGCTLISRRAMCAASFDGYDGKGTQDLFLNWRRWFPNDMKMCVITHCVCEHVVTDGTGKRVHAFAHHEVSGECKGHLRVQHRPFYRFDGTDRREASNTGVIESKQE